MTDDDVVRRQTGMRLACTVLGLAVDREILTATREREAADMFTHECPRSFVLFLLCPRVDEIPYSPLIGLDQSMNNTDEIT